MRKSFRRSLDSMSRSREFANRRLRAVGRERSIARVGAPGLPPSQGLRRTGWRTGTRFRVGRVSMRPTFSRPHPAPSGDAPGLGRKAADPAFVRRGGLRRASRRIPTDASHHHGAVASGLGGLPCRIPRPAPESPNPRMLEYTSRRISGLMRPLEARCAPHLLPFPYLAV